MSSKSLKWQISDFSLVLLANTGHAMWPAIVLDESLAGGRKGLNKVSGEKSVLVQFFGTHDFARCAFWKFILNVVGVVFTI